jgi:hypothetical protein
MQVKIYLLLILTLITDPIGKVDRIAKANALKKEAKEAFLNENYEQAISNYRFLIDSMNLQEDKLMLNLANAQYKMADSAAALRNYQKLTSSSMKDVKSNAYQQLGVLNNTPGNEKVALEYFKNALKADPTNEDARYNYELLKKLIKEQEQNQDQKDDQKDDEKEDQEKKDQQQKDQDKKDEQKKEDQEQEKGEDQNQDQQDQDKEKQEQEQQDQKSEQEKKEQEQKEGEENDEEQEGKENEEKEELPQSTKEKLQELKISPEKAKMILDAMKNQEVQYIQQNKKKSKKRSNNDKPDW